MNRKKLTFDAAALQPTDANVLIEELELDTLTAGGIQIADSRKQPYAAGRIVAVGSGHVVAGIGTVALDVKLNQIVLYHESAGWCPQAGRPYRLIAVGDIHAVVGGNPQLA